jgi:DNA-binding SARP family transcriptional activator
MTRTEVLVEGAQLHVWFGSEGDADSLLAEAQPGTTANPALEADWRITGAELALLRGDSARALALLEFDPVALTTAGQLSRYQVLRAFASTAAGEPDAANKLNAAQALAMRQQATLWVTYCRLLQGLHTTGPQASNAVVGARPVRAVIHMLAHVIVPRMAKLDVEATELVAEVAAQLPGHWRPALRRTIDDDGAREALPAARMLDSIGEAEDVPRLRSFVRHTRVRGADASLGRGLARAIAPRVFIEDLGLTSVRVGAVTVPGTEIRRKALGLLLFLASRPKYAATRDQVLDALWPDQEPNDAVNSLNQTVYFLRRIFEPEYVEDLSPGYVHHNSDVLWLDAGLVTSRAATCRELLASIRGVGDPADVDRVAALYTGQFALEFSYEEWASTFRDAVHGEFLEVVERAVLDDVDSGHFDRALMLARRAVMVEPSAESLHLLLIRVCRRLGAHAAAAERYAAYSQLMRSEYGLEPAPLESL